MTVTCPNGHLSTAEDYCDTCGVPIVADQQGQGAGTTTGGTTSQSAGTPASPGSPDASAAPGEPAEAGTLEEPGEVPEAAAAPGGEHTCPNCGMSNVDGALFCEACGYDFTTGVMPRGAEPEGAAGAADASAQPGSGLEPGAAEGPGDIAGVTAESGGARGSGPEAGAFEWVAEIWVDPDWYRTQEAEDPCPSPGLPVIVPLHKRSVLLGRTSVSRNTHPEIELSSDPGVSRRHAQLTTDGTRWFVEDLGSSNGTFVGAASGSLPEQPIPVGPKTELSDDDRLYVGAWTRVVVRRATPEEVDTYA